ncbi:uncharacterized protein BX664DRAFT_237594, partial [Halteromyces radiatus]|uniref:uncharacterized protein n=1 Tax=Halteromyces radiatus TaxID=101107 RepID=UPI00221EBD75
DLGNSKRSWSQIVATGQKMKVPTLSRRSDTEGTRKAIDTKVIYERSDLAEQLRIHRAESILQQALHDDAVLFELPRDELRDHIAAYQLIQETCGRVLGCRNIDNGRLRQQYYLIEATFAAVESYNQAVTSGVT